MISRTNTVAVAILTIAAALGLAAFAKQRQTVKALRAEFAEHAVRSRSASSTAPAEAPPSGGIAHPPQPGSGVAESAGKVSTSAEAPLTSDEKIELMRLRSRVADLRERQRALAGITNRYAKLQGQLQSVSNAVAGRLPAGFIRRADAKNRGNATPEAAMETFIWAFENRNFEGLLSLVPRSQVAGLRDLIEKQGSEEFFKSSPPIPGFAVRGREDHGPTETTLLLETATAGPPMRMRMHFEEGGWRIGR